MELKKLAAMGWHCITVWECELTPKRREETLESIAFTLNHIWLQDVRPHSQAFSKGREEMVYPLFEEEDDAGRLMAAEEVSYE